MIPGWEVEYYPSGSLRTLSGKSARSGEVHEVIHRLGLRSGFSRACGRVVHHRLGEHLLGEHLLGGLPLDGLLIEGLLDGVHL